MQRIGPISADVSAQVNQHILIDFDGFDPTNKPDILVAMPPVSKTTIGQRFRVSELAADGGVGSGGAVRLIGTFAPLLGGGYAASGYVIANDGHGHSRRGAHIELLCLEDGWIIVAEGCQPMAPLGWPGWLQKLKNLFRSSKRKE